MRICIPTETDAGIEAKVYGHFGSAPCLVIYDTEKDDYETVDNSNQRHAHGTCHPIGVLDGKNVDAVVCASMGKRAIQKLNEASIRAYKSSGVSVQEVVNEYRAGELEEISLENACRQHGCH